jgi:tRNA (cmo5U34)-methyltransferase
MSTHSVRRHLRVETAAYDAVIRRFIPGYETMIEVVAGALAASGPDQVIDLGAGTGALSEAILAHGGAQTVELIDVDAEMLEQARRRLERFGARVRVREMSFLAPLPRCDGAAASLALHHIPAMDEKRALYRRICAAIRPGGVFVNGDATMPADPAGRQATYRVWAEHMMACGIDEARAFEHFEEWADEDTYFPLDEELAAMRAAGFDAECIWQEGAIAVVVGRTG